MLSITVKLITSSDNYNTPDSMERTDLAHVQIVNKGDHPDAPDRGNYRWTIQEPDGSVIEGELDDFNRDHGALDLLWRVLGMWKLHPHTTTEDINAMMAIVEEETN